jgi:hypothetical protein
LIRKHPIRWLAVAGTVTVTAGLVATYAAQASPAAAAPTDAQLTQLFAAGRHIPASAVGGIDAGTLHVGSYNGASWATAAFRPGTSDSTTLQTAFQDGGSGAVFRQNADGGWQLVNTGMYGCAAGLPTALAQQWGITQPASVCNSSQTARQDAARQAPTQGSTIGQTIANIALGQVGVLDSPSSETDALDCDPYSALVGAQSPNSDGCGLDTGISVEDEQETWCSDFAKWVWQQAGVTVDMNTINAAALTFYDWGQQQGETMTADSTTPAVGDAVEFYPAGEANAGVYSDHVGIVTAVNSDGTVNLVNGDFGGPGDPIKVEYDPDVSLATWASAVWAPGEQWTFVAPPTGTQQAAPSVSINGPSTVVAGESVNFSAGASAPGGSITQYLWTFGDGRNTNESGRSVSHEWAEDGIYPVTVSATSSLGTVTTKVLDVDVTGASSEVATVPNNGIWFQPGPFDQYVFQRSPSGGLVYDFTDSATWLRLPAAGQPDNGSGLTSLAYPDPNNDDAMTPHAYYTQGGALTQTYLDGTSWTSQALAGNPEADSAIVASAGSSGPDVFYFGSGGQLSEASDNGGSWSAATLTGPATTTPGALALADTARGSDLFYLDRHDTLMEEIDNGGTWQSEPITGPFGVKPGSSLSAVTAGSDEVDVFYLSGSDRLTEARVQGLSSSATQLPGAPAASAQLASTSYLEGSSQSAVGSSVRMGQVVYYLTGSGQPEADYQSATGLQWQSWQSAALPGTATGIYGADAYPVSGQPLSAYLTNSGQLSLDQASGPSGTWSEVPLPTATGSWANQIVLYAATPADQATALSIAAEEGLPASDVITSYYDAWLDVETYNEYLVISIGDAATTALYQNPCGWANPSDGDYATGTTPFSIQYPPLNSVPGAANEDNFETGDSADSADTVALATDLVDYAAHGTFPAGVTLSNLPEFNWSPPDTCEGSAG